MFRRVVARSFALLPVLLGAVTVVFILLRMSGDPVALLAGMESTEEDRQQIRKHFGLDAPLHIQYVRFIGNAARGDFGISIRTRRPAFPDALARVPATLQLSFGAVILMCVIGVPLGIIAALNRGRLLDMGVVVLATLGQSVPTFWLAVMLVIVFAVELHMFPAAGRERFASFVLPTLSLTAFHLGALTRLVRSSMLEIISEDYIRTARAKGLRELTVIAIHAFRNAVIPVTAFVANSFAHMLSGAVVTETVFAWPGIGRFLVVSVEGRDYALVQSCVFILAILVVLTMWLADMLYLFFDPRLR